MAYGAEACSGRRFLETPYEINMDLYHWTELVRLSKISVVAPMPDTDTLAINIVTACDNAYVQHTGVFLKSLLATNPDVEFRLFILVPDDFIHRDSLERNLDPHRLEFLSINLSETVSLKVSEYISVATYFRLFIDKLLPTDIDRIVYLDSDILIAGPVNELWAVDLGEYELAAVSDAIFNTDQPVRERLGLAATSNYFNAGVLLIDLVRWKNARVGERALDFVLKYPDLVNRWDQDALNHVLNGHFRELTREWNFQDAYIRRGRDGRCSADDIRELGAAKIIHFTWKSKPWHYLNNHPMKALYWHYLRQTDWRDYRPPDQNVRNVLKKNLQQRAPALLNAARQARKLWRLIYGSLKAKVEGGVT
jgi:lipopolysaccharide biosynthesis glycosyltransferase